MYWKKLLVDMGIQLSAIVWAVGTLAGAVALHARFVLN